MQSGDPGGAEETETQGDSEGLKDQAGDMGLADWGGVIATEDNGGTRGKEPSEMKGWRVEVQLETLKSEAQPGRRLTKVEPEG